MRTSLPLQGMLSRLLLVGAILSLTRPVSAQEQQKPAVMDNSFFGAVAGTAATAEGVAGIPQAETPEPGGQEAQSSFPLSQPGQLPSLYPVVPPPITSEPPTMGEKFSIYLHQTYGPPALVLPLFGSGLGMLNPKSQYPRVWKDGAGAFGRIYGDHLATITSRRTASFLTQAALHEDSRYKPSTSTNPFVRTFHALAFTFVDKTDGGHNTIAVSNFAGAAAGGFVGMAYLPHGFNDVTHAEQRMALEFATTAAGNVAAEFEPQWGPILKKLRIPKILPPWWVPLHAKQP
jgi:hypothetical protein